jgi:chaperonin GroEL
MPLLMPIEGTPHRIPEKGGDVFPVTTGATLGLAGGGRMSRTSASAPSAADDTVRVAKQIELEDPLEKLGAELIKALWGRHGRKRLDPDSQDRVVVGQPSSRV